MKELKYWIALNELPGIGLRSRQNLLMHYKHPRNFFEDPNKLKLLRKMGVSAISPNKQSEIIKKASSKVKYMQSKDYVGIDINAKEYPVRLKQCQDAPTLIYSTSKVNFGDQHRKVLGIVGTRTPTLDARIACRKLIADLHPYNSIIVSGLAEGIDTVALQTALEYGLETIAVLAHGLEKIYPMSNRGLSNSVKNHGALITELANGTKILPHNFPQRNRIIAGLSDAVVVVQSGLKGGSMITANFANEYNREVFAFPGNIENSKFSGCNHLIKTHRAHLLTSVKDIVYNMGWNSQVVEKNLNQNDVNHVLQKVNSPSLKELSGNIKKEHVLLRKKILQLELEGCIEHLPGNWYSNKQKVA